MANRTFQTIIAISSVILRSGMAAVLKRLPGLSIHPVEVPSVDALRTYLQLHQAALVIMDPNFSGRLDLRALKEEVNNARKVKYVAILSSVIDSSTLKEYHDSFTIYDDTNTISQKLNKLLLSPTTDETEGQEQLSQREKEIITFVVKGLTNKAIADKLCISVHTVITHRRNIARKLQIHSPAGLTIYAIVNKLVELKDVETLNV